MNLVAIVSFWIIFTLQTAELHGTVERVVDGDTLIVLLADGTRERVRLAAVDAPEISRKNPDPRGLAAAEFVRRACLGQEVLLRPIGRRTVFQRDPYRRLVSRVIVRGSDLGGSLVLLGLALPWRIGADRELQEFSTSSKRGNLRGEKELTLLFATVV